MLAILSCGQGEYNDCDCVMPVFLDTAESGMLSYIGCKEKESGYPPEFPEMIIHFIFL